MENNSRKHRQNKQEQTNNQARTTYTWNNFIKVNGCHCKSSKFNKALNSLSRFEYTIKQQQTSLEAHTYVIITAHEARRIHQIIENHFDQPDMWVKTFEKTLDVALAFAHGSDQPLV